MENLTVINADHDNNIQPKHAITVVPEQKKNIENLRKLKKTVKYFNQIYEIFQIIACENDIDSLLPAIKDKFDKVKNELNHDILTHSCVKCDFPLFKMLFEYATDFSEIQILLRYTMNMNQEFIRYLVKIPGIPPKYYSDYLLHASKLGQYEIVKLLISEAFQSNYYKIDINAKDYLGRTALMNAFILGNSDMINLFLTIPGIDVNANYIENRTTLIHASKRGHLYVVKVLLTVSGIDVNAKDDDNNTALIWASREGHHEVVKFLLTVPGIDVNAKNKFNNTALIRASREGHHEVVKLLLTVPGIDVNAKL